MLASLPKMPSSFSQPSIEYCCKNHHLLFQKLLFWYGLKKESLSSSGNESAKCSSAQTSHLVFTVFSSKHATTPTMIPLVLDNIVLLSIGFHVKDQFFPRIMHGFSLSCKKSNAPSGKRFKQEIFKLIGSDCIHFPSTIQKSFGMSSAAKH